jgi:hypothetical protein
MRIIGAFDVHRKQIAFKWLDRETGEVRRGHIMPALREPVREFLVPSKGCDAHFALEATTGWRFRSGRTLADRVDGSSCRAGRDRRAPRNEAPRQDRSS